MRIVHIPCSSQKGSDLLRGLARFRGCQHEEHVQAFYASDPPLPETFPELPGFAQAIDLIRQARQQNQAVVIFGDYDCDGITALVQMVKFLKACGVARLTWFIPDRMEDDYGLTRSAVDKCLAQHNPKLLITVDCGSSSGQVIRHLLHQQVNCVIIDHHPFDQALAPPSSVPHLNPKAHPHLHSLQDLSASGLVYLLTRAAAPLLKPSNWDEHYAVILAGLGTVVDVMPLLEANRSIVRRALHTANTSALNQWPGLRLLNEVARQNGTINSSTFSFVWGPRLNATGRVDLASASVELLLASDETSARPWVEHCESMNLERKKVQTQILSEALDLVHRLIETKGLPSCLVLAQKNWHPGVVGIVASKLKDIFRRPSIVMGRQEDGLWKGSGRSLEPFDLGAAVREAADQGIIQTGGGHKMAAGVKLFDEQLPAFDSWLQNKTAHIDPEDYQPEYEVWGSAEWHPAEIWERLFNRAEPFGHGNQRPHLLLDQAALKWGPKPIIRKNDGLTWAIKAGFSTQEGNFFFCTWTNLSRAEREWYPGCRQRLLIQLQRSEVGDKIYEDWRVIDAEPLKPDR